LKSVGPNATLVEDDIEAVIRGLKAQLIGEIQVGGPDLARSLTDSIPRNAKHFGNREVAVIEFVFFLHR
jgi:hypothetical protein